MDYYKLYYAALLGYYIWDIVKSPSLEPGEGDYIPPGEKKFLMIANVLFLGWWLSLFLPFFTPEIPWGHPLYWSVGGTLLFVLGRVVRQRAIETLGRFFTYRLSLKREHVLIKEGPYRYIRHPSYTGSILEGLGLLTVSRSVAGLVLFIISVSILFFLRIRREEEMLRERFGDEYIEYSKKTKRLIPFIF